MDDRTPRNGHCDRCQCIDLTDACTCTCVECLVVECWALPDPHAPVAAARSLILRVIEQRMYSLAERIGVCPGGADCESYEHDGYPGICESCGGRV